MSKTITSIELKPGSFKEAVESYIPLGTKAGRTMISMAAPVE